MKRGSERRAATLDARVLRVAEVRSIEAAAAAARPSDSLMERAGRAVADAALSMAAERAGPILVLVGPGNNGGDALVAARELHRRGVEVRIALLADVPALHGDALRAWSYWQAIDPPPPVDPRAAVGHASLVIDGLFGIGFSRDIDGTAREWIDAVNASRGPVLSIDVPSGVDADTGHVGTVAIRADRTVTFLGRKVGLSTGEGLDHCGTVVVDLLGVDDASTTPTAGTLDRPVLFTGSWKPRRANSHKGSFGSVAVIGGHDGMIGAALLASRMALHAGAGRVYVRLLASNAPGYDVVQPELMLRRSLDGVDVQSLAIGPGLGRDDAAIAILAESLGTPAKLVLDADALNAIAEHPRLMEQLAARESLGLPMAVLTPHPLEAARLLGSDAKAVQKDRIAAATSLARKANGVVVLKGAGSVIADPSGAWCINPTGNPALATGGTGDVLCGLVGALLAQGMPPLDAARAATWLHGTAADRLVAAGIGPVGITASELVIAIRDALNDL